MLRSRWLLRPLLLVLTLCGVAHAADSCAPLPPATSQDFQQLLQAFLNDRCYVKQNWQHDPQIRGTNGVHPNVKVWYSPAMWRWMTVQDRKGEAPQGGILIKEQYGDPKHPIELTDWAVMIRDTAGSWDGWWWGDLSAPSTVSQEPPPTPKPGEPECTPAEYPYAAFGEYCINCHASAVHEQDTFASTRYVFGFPPPRLTSTPPDDNIHFRLSHLPRLLSGHGNPVCMVPESNDHVVAGPKPNGPQTFLTSDQCTSCHNATATLSPARSDLPSMLYYLNGSSPPNNPQTVNLSPNGEWRFSMMGLAGRDPIFFSQLNSEVALHGNLTTQPGQAKAYVENLCLHCHGVMGQRQYHEDTGKLFTRDQMQDPNSTYGALARDGISCTVCHRIAAEGLGTKETYTGNFKLSPPEHIDGPFKDPLKLPMKNALGMKPQYGEQITDSGLCGSCHTIILPVFRANGEPVLAKNGIDQKTFIEQATFFEWQNSKFADNGATPESCQQCHMPNTFLHDGVLSQPLAYKIANIEDNTFPPVDFRAPDEKITLKTRNDYRRHLLLGINVFALEMFKQFRTELGLYAPNPEDGVINPDPMLRQSLNTEDGVDNAIDQSTNLIAKTRTADIKILSVIRTNTGLQADVQVINKAGHSFPSGVGFRRAFLNFQVLDTDKNVVWGSGNVAPEGSRILGGLKGVIVDGEGRPLPTEVFTRSQQHFQAHYWAANPITQENQVQIYEELVTNPEGFLTTSFIALNNKVKDNRLQPQGWSPDGPEAEETGPVGTCVSIASLAGPKKVCDPDYMNGSGSSVVRYRVPLTDRTKGSAAVRVTLYYQTVPPYFQLQRATDATGVDTRRLVRFVRNLRVSDTPVNRWVLPIGSDEAPVM